MGDENSEAKMVRAVEMYLESVTRPTLNPHLIEICTDEKALITSVIKVVSQHAVGSKETRVLDVGGGKGWGQEIGELSGVNYEILDILPTNDDPRVICGDICSTNADLPDGTYDVVFSKDTFEHLLEPWAAATEMVRITANGGLVIVIAPFSWRYHPSPVDTFRFSHTAMRYLFERSGQIDPLLAGYILREDISGFWGNRKDWTPNGKPYSECCETIFVGRKRSDTILFDPMTLDSDYSADHGGKEYFSEASPLPAPVDPSHTGFFMTAIRRVLRVLNNSQ